MNRLALLGSIQITRNGEPVRGFESRKALALLCYLALRAEPVARVELANLFWGDKTEQQGRGNLSRVLNNLSTLFPNSFRADRESVQVKRDAFEMDCAEFGEPTADDGQRTTEQVVSRLSSVVALYRGEFMAGMYLDDCPDFELWLVQERERWQQRIVSVLECLGGYHTRQKEYATALPFAARLLELDPWREETHRELMRLLAQTGQRSAALQQYETARRVLQEELGVEPSAETSALYEKIRAEEIAPHKTPPHNLPTHLTTFFGRETELTRISARLNNPDCRLLTLVGAGGMGKTRLALEAAKNILDSFRDGVYFVPLAPIGVGQTEFIVPALASALNLSLTGQLEPKTQVLNFLREKEMLLLLDNWEHLLDGAELALEILQRAPRVKILATSREPLDLQAEWITRVEGLNFPTTPPRQPVDLLMVSAPRLFIERAQRANDEFELNQETARDIVHLTQLVEGMPLALELAAARTRTLRVSEICAQVEKNFDALATTLRDVETRHRSLRAVLDWSYSLLSASEQQLVRRLAVFAGGWTLDGAVQVCGRGLEPVTFENLSQLVSKSLVSKDDIDGEIRYRMLAPIREYGREKLIEAGEEASVRAAHLNFFMKLAEQASAEFSGAEQGQWLKRLKVEVDNLRTALTWRGQEPKSNAYRLRLAAALSYFWQVRGMFEEGQNFLRAALEDTPPEPSIVRAKAFVGLGTIGWLRGEYDAAITWLERGLAQYKRIGDVNGIAHALYQIGASHFYLGRFERTTPLWEESLSLARKQGDVRLTAILVTALAEVARYQGDYTRAQKLNEEGYALASEIQHFQHIGLTLNNLGLLATRQGEYIRAVQLHRESLKWYQASAETRLVPECLDGLASALTELGQSSKAAVLMGASDALRESVGLTIPPIERPDYDRVLRCVRENLQDKFQTEWEKGRAMSLEQSIAYALEDTDQTPKVFIALRALNGNVVQKPLGS